MYFGIDLGTSNSAIATVSEARAGVFKTPEGTDVMPSVIYRDKRGNQAVGVRAFDQASLAPENAVEGFKSLIGTTTPFVFGSAGTVITPEQASTEVLRTMVGYALVEAGATSIAGAVVTIPAAFDQVQSEATLSAARAAGLPRVALLQEPVAAALAAMAGAQDRNGLFLVYDLGGGTFDAAVVHAIDGEVTVVGHAGVKLLGGRDLDRGIVDSVAVPWLMRNFDLPAGFVADPQFRRLVRVARRSAERAKISLSTSETTTISAADEEVRLDDRSGEPIYLDIPFARSELEKLAANTVGQSIECCRSLLASVGYRHEDVARVVLIGGPTKIPFLRKWVERELGIAVEDASRVDPMTAVAIGAAIYCEGRDWSDAGSTAKATRRTERAGEQISVTYDYEARTASEAARLEVRRIAGSDRAEVLVEDRRGWSSGRVSLAQPVILELPLVGPGEHTFRATVFGADGAPVPQASREITIDRLLASTSGVPATQTIAVKVLDDSGRNSLHVILHKGTLLPATGAVRYRLAAPLRAGTAGRIRIELYQIADERLLDPSLNLLIGEFRIDAADLPEFSTLKKGDEVVVHWAMSEGQEITTEVDLPGAQARFDRRKFYNWQLGQQDFSGESGG